MNPLTIRPLQWQSLQDLCEVAPLDRGDLACIAELREVLERHGRLGRFALHLIHKHFELADDEVLVEYSDPARRESRLCVERRDSAAASGAIPTTWVLDPPRPRVVCVCAFRADQGHLGRHESAGPQSGSARKTVSTPV
ncbi:MAG: hypothetical protein ABI809_05190 [Caldimonas sp.]